MNRIITIQDLGSAMYELSIEALIRHGNRYLAQISALLIQIQYPEIHISFPATKLQIQSQKQGT